MSRAAAPRPRIVLDTNVSLDAFVFADAGTASLRAALTSGAIEAVTRDDCREEWHRVLHYPQLRLDADRREAAAALFDRHVRCVTTEASPQALPRCADPDDQKFLELARDAGARWLLSRDNALLILARRMQRDGGCLVLTPEAWAAMFAAHADADAGQISKR